MSLSKIDKEFDAYMRSMKADTDDAVNSIVEDFERELTALIETVQVNRNRFQGCIGKFTKRLMTRAGLSAREAGEKLAPVYQKLYARKSITSF